jgi:hypothetical protein
MIVFVAGMPRSGSTFSFNVAHHTLRARGLSTFVAPPSNNPARAGSKPVTQNTFFLRFISSMKQPLLRSNRYFRKTT